MATSIEAFSSFYSRFADVTEIVNDNARSPITPVSSECCSDLPALKPYVRCPSPPKRVHNRINRSRRRTVQVQAPSDNRIEMKSSLSFPPSNYRHQHTSSNNNNNNNNNSNARYRMKVLDDSTNNVTIPSLLIRHPQSIQLPFPMLASVRDDVLPHDVAPKMPCRRLSAYQSTYDYMSEALNISSSIEGPIQQPTESPDVIQAL